MAYAGPGFMPKRWIEEDKRKEFDAWSKALPRPSEPLRVQIQTDEFNEWAATLPRPSQELRVEQDTADFADWAQTLERPSEQIRGTLGLPSPTTQKALDYLGSVSEESPMPIAKLTTNQVGMGSVEAEGQPEADGSPENPFPGIVAGLRTPFGPAAAQISLPGQTSKATEDEGAEERVRQGRAPFETADQVMGGLVKHASRQAESQPANIEALRIGNWDDEAAQATVRAQEARGGFGSIGDAVSSGVRAAGGGTPPPSGSAWALVRKGREESTKAAATPLTDRLEQFRRGAVRSLTDRGVDLNEFQKTAKETLGRQLRADEMVAELARLNWHDAAKVRVDQEVKPLISRMGDEAPLVSDLLTARHNVDVATAKGNAARMFSGGVTATESDQAIREMRQALGPDFARIEAMADAVVNVHHRLLDEKVAVGLVTPEAAAKWKKEYPNYVKTEISDYLEDAMNGGTGQGQSLSVRSNGIKRLTVEGTDARREDPIASLVREVYQHERLVTRSRTFNAFAKLRAAVPEIGKVFREVPNGYSGTNKEHTVTGFIAGERKTFVTSSPEMARVIKMEGTAPIPYITPMMQVFKELITARNPAFLVGNAMIDAPLAFLRLMVEEGGPTSALRVGKALIEGYVDAFQGLTKGEFTGADTARYLRGGGGMGGAYDPMARTGQQLLDDVRGIESDVKSALVDVLKLEPVAKAGERVELGPRVAAMKLAEQRGMRATEAVVAGRDVTLDFARGGTVVKTLNQIIPFLNPAFQGAMSLSRTAQKNPKAAALVAGTFLVAPTLAIEAWNRSDPERARDYEDVPQYIKDRGWVIMLPGEAPTNERGERVPQHIDINLRAFSIVPNVVKASTGAVLGDDWRGWADFLLGSGKQITPLTSVDQLFPPGLSTALELQTNQDFYRGRMIATDESDRRASALSQTIGDATGVRPSQVEHVTRDVGGAAAQMAHGASDILAGRTKDSEAPQDIPVAGAFVRRVVRGDIGQRLENARRDALWESTREMLGDWKIDWEPTPIRAEIDGAPLTRGETERLQTLANLHVNDAIQQVVRGGDFRSADALKREEMIRAAAERGKNRARREMASQVGDLARRSELERRRKLEYAER